MTEGPLGISSEKLRPNPTNTKAILSKIATNSMRHRLRAPIAAIAGGSVNSAMTSTIPTNETMITTVSAVSINSNM